MFRSNLVVLAVRVGRDVIVGIGHMLDLGATALQGTDRIICMCVESIFLK